MEKLSKMKPIPLLLSVQILFYSILILNSCSKKEHLLSEDILAIELLKKAEESCKNANSRDCYENVFQANNIQYSEKALKKISERCEKNEFKACAYSGWQFYLRKNFHEAERLASKGCDSNDVQSCSVLGQIYYFGLNDKKKAAHVFTLSCERGSNYSCYYLSMIFEREFKLNEALSLYLKACNNKNPASCFRAGCVYLKKANKEKGFEYLKRSLNLGFKDKNSFLIDPDLESVRDSKEFKQLLAEYQI